MNKGLRLATGEWVLFLHADDELLAPDSISQVLQVLDQTDAQIAGFPIRCGQPEKARLLRPRGATFWLRFKTGLMHHATFTKRRVFDSIGKHDEIGRASVGKEWVSKCSSRWSEYSSKKKVIDTRITKSYGK